MDESKKKVKKNKQKVREEEKAQILESMESSDVGSDTGKADDYKDKYLRLLAEYSNFVKRNEEETRQLLLLGNKRILLEVISLADDLEVIMEQEIPGPFRGMLEMIKQKLDKILALENVRKINISVGDSYDPKFCEVVHTVEVDDTGLIGKIVAVVKSGYLMGDIILRTATVVVGKQKSETDS